MLRSVANSLQTKTSFKINILEFYFKTLFVPGGLLLMLSQYVKPSAAQIMQQILHVVATGVKCIPQFKIIPSRPPFYSRDFHVPLRL